MPPGLTDLQIQALKCLGLNGPLHIQRIQELAGMNYATAHRSVKHLEKRNLVWLSDVDPRGPKGARTYSLTPYGVLELYLRGDLETGRVTQNWPQATPRLVMNHDKIDFHEELKSMLSIKYPGVVEPLNATRQLKWRENYVIIHRNILETIILEEIIHSSEVRLERLIEVIREDKQYLKTWERWFSTKTFIYNYLKSIDRKIHENNNKEY